MVNKNMGKVIQMLTPENYIRTKGRSLPLYECRINSNWEVAQEASCLVARKHNNGNITYCLYLVDLLCLGVKDTHYVFNESERQYKEFIVEREEDIQMEIVDYALVHNIIRAGIEFAGEYEFKPCKDYLNLTRYFLEKDTDNIELIEIECGDDDGRPVYLYDSFTPVSEKNRIIAQLERTAGADNYTIIDEDEIDEDVNDDFDDDDFDDSEDMYSNNTTEENRKIFTGLYKGLEDSNDSRDLIRLTKVTDELFDTITDGEKVEQYYDDMFDLFSTNVETEEVSKELLGLKPGEEISEIFGELFMSVYINIHKNLKKAREGLQLFHKEQSDLPAAAFLELLILKKEDSKTFAKKLQQYKVKYADYPLITLLWLINIYQSEEISEDIQNTPFNLDTLFPERESLHFVEMFYFLLYYSLTVAYEGDADRMEAFYEVLEEIEVPYDMTYIVRDSFSLARIGFLSEFFEIE